MLGSCAPVANGPENVVVFGRESKCLISVSAAAGESGVADKCAHGYKLSVKNSRVCLAYRLEIITGLMEK